MTATTKPKAKLNAADRERELNRHAKPGSKRYETNMRRSLARIRKMVSDSNHAAWVESCYDTPFLSLPRTFSE